MRRWIPPVLTIIIILSLFFIYRPISENQNIVKKDPPKIPNDWFFSQRAYPQESIDYQAWHAAQEQALFFRNEQRLENLQWSAAGPSNIGGRITALSGHPSQPNTYFAGAADGGIWKTNDGGTNWQSVFDFGVSLSIGAVCVDPNNPYVIYAGTGEANSSGDSYPGNGIYRSGNGGVSWTHIGLPNSYYIGRIAVNPQNSSQIFVAATGLLFGKNAERGIYRSNNSGSSWEQVLFVSDSTAAIDVVISPLNPNIIYAAMWERIRRPLKRQAGGITSAIYQSTNGGTTWNKLGPAQGLPASSTATGRIGLALAPSNPDVVYAIYADHPGYFDGVYKTINGGQNWSRVNDFALSNIYSSFGWYFGQIYVDPVDENTVYAMGVDMFKSTNGGSSWNEIAWNTHVDHHAMYISPNNPQKIILGNDGGLFTSTNGGSGFQKVYDLPITQFYAATIDKNNPQRLYGGTQDNGTLRTMTGQVNDWERIYGGDGFYCIVDPNNSNIIYAEYQWGGLGKSTNGGTYFNSATSGISSNDRRNWMVPVVMDPNSSDTLYYGTYRLYQTSNAAGYWTAISPDLSNGPYAGERPFGTITTIAVAPTNSNIIYCGTDDGNVWISEDKGGNWNKVSSQLPARWVTRVAVDPFDENSALVTYSGYPFNQYVGYVFKTSDKGQNWTDITGSLPLAPVNVAVYDPGHVNTFYIGTDVGVYATIDGGANWLMLGNNLPNAVVMDMVLHQGTRTLIAATHGRSMYKTDLTNFTQLTQKSKTQLPAEFKLAQNYPNPFNNSTSIQYFLPKADEVTISIYDLTGRKIATLISENQSSGWHKTNWNGTNNFGKTVASGTYIYRLTTSKHSVNKKLTIMK